MASRPHVVIATPCFGAMVHQGYMLAILRLMASPLAARITLGLEMLGHDSLITRSRNTLVARFLAQPEATHLLFVDADIVFEPEQLDRMLAFDRPLVAGMYPLKVRHWGPLAEARQRWGEPAQSASLLYVGEPCTGAEARRDGAFVTALHAGTGFMLIRRDTLMALIEAYPETAYRRIHAYGDAHPEALHHALFECRIDPDTGTYVSEDFSFCARWRAIGGEVWLDTQGRLTHVGAHDFAGDPGVRFVDAPPPAHGWAGTAS